MNVNTEHLLSEKMKKIMFTPNSPQSGHGYGYGWSIGRLPLGRSSDSIDVIEHGGGINGFNTLISRIPSERDLVVLLNFCE
jgi:CubicO group peptidase (beta-lactamase class C family)